MIFCVPSIMHTGTFLMQDILKEYTHVGCAVEPENGSVIFGHTANSIYPCMDKCMEKYPSIIPMRHPARVWHSWKNRNKDNIKMFREQWGCMSELVQGREVYYIHVDQPEYRDNEIQEINTALGLDLKTNWPVVNSIGGTHDIEISQQMIDEIPVWILDYHNTTLGNVKWHSKASA